MRDTDELITDALRDLAAQAVTRRPATDDIWRAGRRRRRRGVVAAAAAGGAAVAVVLALAVGGSPAGSAGHGDGPGGAMGAAATVALRTRIMFEQVAGSSRPPCAADADPMPGSAGAAASCLRFTGTGMTITRFESAHVQRNRLGQYQLDIRLTHPDARRFATLTRELAGLHSPRNRLAIVTNGHVLADPVVLAPVATGQAAIPGFPSKPQAEFLLATLTGG